MPLLNIHKYIHKVARILHYSSEMQQGAKGAAVLGMPLLASLFALRALRCIHE